MDNNTLEAIKYVCTLLGVLGGFIFCYFFFKMISEANK